MAVFDVAFSSGGTKGIAFAGALDVLAANDHDIGRVIGTSVGAISATLLAAGYKPGELVALAEAEGDERSVFASFLAPPGIENLREALNQEDSETHRLIARAIEKALLRGLDYLGELPNIGATVKLALQFVDQSKLQQRVLEGFLEEGVNSSPVFASVLSFLEFGGFFSTEVFERWLTERLAAKLPRFEPDWTLEQFHEQTGVDLSVVTADTSVREALVLNHRTAPQCPVVQAVRMSMSIPTVWREVVWQEDWGTYLGTDLTGNLLVDGGAMINTPIRHFADPDMEDVRRVMGEPDASAGLPLGLILEDELPVPGYVEDETRPSKVIERLGRLVDTVTDWEDEVIRERYENVVCRIPTRGYAALETAMPPERVDVLINSGRCAMTEHLEGRNL